MTNRPTNLQLSRSGENMLRNMEAIMQGVAQVKPFLKKRGHTYMLSTFELFHFRKMAGKKMEEDFFGEKEFQDQQESQELCSLIPWLGLASVSMLMLWVNAIREDPRAEKIAGIAALMTGAFCMSLPSIMQKSIRKGALAALRFCAGGFIPLLAVSAFDKSRNMRIIALFFASAAGLIGLAGIGGPSSHVNCRFGFVAAFVCVIICYAILYLSFVMLIQQHPTNTVQIL